MKKIMMVMVLGALMACLVPTQAQNTTLSTPTTQQRGQEWKTTTMQGSGSAYSSQVTPVGATTATQQASTTYSNNLPGGGPRKGFGTNTDGGTTTDESSPIGDAMWPLMAFALIFCGVVALRRRKALSR